MRARIVIATVALTMLAGACSGAGNPLGTGPGSTDPTNGLPGSTQPTTGSTNGGLLGGGNSLPTGGGLDTSGSRPLPIAEGFALFDSYIFELSVRAAGPSPQEVIELVSETGSDRASDANFERVVTRQDGPDFEEPSEFSSEVIRVGDQSCAFDGDAWVFTDVPDGIQEALEMRNGLFDVVISPDNPQLVGEETVNGIPSRRYSFQVERLGSDTGAQVFINDANYWVAIDGGFLVKYSLVTETRTAPADDPDAEIYRVDISGELTSIDEPLNITLPAECLEAESTTTTAAAATTTNPPPTTQGVEALREARTRLRGDVAGNFVDEFVGCFRPDDYPTNVFVSTFGIDTLDRSVTVFLDIELVAGTGDYPVEVFVDVLEGDNFFTSSGTGTANVRFLEGESIKVTLPQINYDGDAGLGRIDADIWCTIEA